MPGATARFFYKLAAPNSKSATWTDFQTASCVSGSQPIGGGSVAPSAKPPAASLMLENAGNRYNDIVLVIPINLQIHHHPANGTEQEYRKNAARIGHLVTNL